MKQLEKETQGWEQTIAILARFFAQVGRGAGRVTACGLENRSLPPIGGDLLVLACGDERLSSKLESCDAIDLLGRPVSPD